MNGLLYLYTMNRKKTLNGDYEYYYVVDGNPMGTEDASDLGDMEENHYDALVKNFETGKTNIGEFTNDEYVAALSAYVPTKNTSSEVIGAMGADFNGKNVKSLLDSKKIEMIIFACDLDD